MICAPEVQILIKWFALRAPDVQILIKWFALRAPEVQILIKWFALRAAEVPDQNIIKNRTNILINIKIKCI